jgi:outer membrane protein OmpA-like peptidoglycan-associated protein
LEHVTVTRFQAPAWLCALATLAAATPSPARALTRLLALEAVGDFTSTTMTGGPRVRIARLGGTLLAHARLVPGNAIYLGAGYERSFFREAIQDESDGVHVVLGDRLSLGGRAALRLEGRFTQQLNSALEGGTSGASIFSASLGLSIYAFGGAPRDQDIDGVADARDRCPGTPTGATVDAVGCPTDTDTDGVFDGLDACAGTAPGARVDARGCPSDSDLDGILDGIDLCPDTPAGATVDPSGCPTDGDGDGVFDGLDQCADTPAGATVDARGCPADADGDAVLDGIDQCPGTPVGAEVDARGCTVERDSDGDGVLDSADRCPRTRPGQEVDGVGCPILFRIEAGQRQPLVLRGVNFETGRSTLTQDSHATLNEVAASLVANPEVRIEIAGHTDATGSRQLNMRLSLARAQAVRAYLAQQGVAPDRMVARGYGPDRPIAPNATAAGRAENRRVELHPLDDSRTNQ